MCLKVLSSPIVRTSEFYIYKSSGVCTLHQFLVFLVESSQSFQLTLIWLILLAERNILPRMRFLYADYELEQASRSSHSSSSPSSVEDQTSVAAAQVRPEIAKLREKTFTSCLTRNSRALILGVFYLVSFIVSVVLSPSYVYTYKTNKLCIYSGFSETPYVLRLAIYFLFFFPILYYLIALATCFSKYFGGEADPIRERLQATDRDRIDLVKKVTLLKCIIEVATEMHTSSYLFLSTTVFELLRLSGLLAILVTTVLFFRYESFYSKLRERFFGSSTNSNNSGNGNNGSGGGSLRGLTVRGRRSPDDTVVDYRNLVENDEN